MLIRVLRNQHKTIILFGVLSALHLGIAGALAPNYLVLFIGVAAVMNLVGYFWSDKIVLSMYRAREVSPSEAPELHALVRDLANRAELPMPRLFLVPGEQPN